MKIGYHASHEQFSPRTLLNLVRMAEQAGFNAALSSDHFHPWSNRQGHSGYAWSWLGAALQATALPFGVVCAPGQRYHPAIIAQAAATLEEMFPDRFWIAAGSGQKLNEAVTGEVWPAKALRNERLKESADIMRALWQGDTVTYCGHVDVEEAKLYTRPIRPPLLIGAAISPATAEWVGSWADGLITTSRPLKELAEVVDAFRKGGGRDKPMYLKVQLSYGATFDEAVTGAWEQWRSVVFDSDVLSELRLPGQFEAVARFVSRDAMHKHVLISEKTKQHETWLREYADMGFDRLYLHNVNVAQEKFIRDFGEKVIPELVKRVTAHD